MLSHLGRLACHTPGMMGARGWIGWAVGAALCAAAVARVLTAEPPPAAEAPLTPELARAIWDDVVAREPWARAQAVTDFPAHRWSQEDAFGAFERSHAEQAAGRHGVSLQTVFRVLDDGLRAHWAAPDGGPAPRVTVEPFAQRPFD